ncbi:MAG: GtrA family protein [Verrucomicrobia bacterium]|nr:GtrA family protein [Verrucomicrobiota bacterium]
MNLLNLKNFLDRERALRFIRFITVGASVAIIDFSGVALFSRFFPPLLSVTFAYFIAVCCHFLLNKFWVFRCRRSDYLKQLFHYGVVITGNWLITVIVVTVCLATFTQNVLIAKLCAIPCATVCNFLLMQTIVFRKHPEQPEEDQLPYTSAAELD